MVTKSLSPRMRLLTITLMLVCFMFGGFLFFFKKSHVNDDYLIFTVSNQKRSVTTVLPMVSLSSHQKMMIKPFDLPQNSTQDDIDDILMVKVPINYKDRKKIAYYKNKNGEIMPYITGGGKQSGIDIKFISIPDLKLGVTNIKKGQINLWSFLFVI